MINWKLFEWEKCIYLLCHNSVCLRECGRACVCMCERVRILLREKSYLCCKHLNSVFVCIQATDEIANTMTRMAVVAAEFVVVAGTLFDSHMRMQNQIQQRADKWVQTVKLSVVGNGSTL